MNKPLIYDELVTFKQGIKFNDNIIQDTAFTNKEIIYNSDKILITNFSKDSDLYTYLNYLFLQNPNIKEFIIDKGEYKISYLFYNDSERFITIKGVGIDKTILKAWDFTNNCENVDTWMNIISNVRYENLTIRNRGFGQYGGERIDHTGRKFELVNVKHEFTLSSPGGYACYLFTKGLNVYLKNYELVTYKTSPVYAGIWISGDVNLEVDNCKVGNYFSKPFVCQGPNNPKINRLKTSGGITGIFFGANKDRPLDGAEIRNCIAEKASEENISFDCYGNNVGLNPTIAEISIKETQLEDNLLKIYCDARQILGSHPNEYYQNYSFAGNEDYLKQFYAVFSQTAGTNFEGYFCKIIDSGIDEKGQYLILNTSKDISALKLNDYSVLNIMSGFFNCTIQNNITRNSNGTGFALYCSFFGNYFENNKEENCRIGSYLYSGKMLALGTWNGSNGNKIINNTFENGFSFIKYGGIKGYNNSYLGNRGKLNLTDEIKFIEGNNSE